MKYTSDARKPRHAFYWKFMVEENTVRNKSLIVPLTNSSNIKYVGGAIAIEQFS